MIEDYLARGVFTLVGVVMLGVVGLIGYVVYDYATAPDTGTVVSRSYSSEHTTTTCSGTQPVICTPVHHPERWTLRLRDGDNEGPISVNERAYDLCTEGTRYPECTR
jgi:hypothetical protein